MTLLGGNNAMLCSNSECQAYIFPEQHIERLAKGMFKHQDCRSLPVVSNLKVFRSRLPKLVDFGDEPIPSTDFTYGHVYDEYGE